jgi:hypothetical protein
LKEIIVPVALFGFNRRVLRYRVHPHKDLQDAIVEAVTRFWEYNVARDIPPDSTPSPDVVRRIIRKPSKVVTFARETVAAIAAMNVAKAAKAAADADVKRLEGIVRGALVDAEAGRYELNVERRILQAKKMTRKSYTVEGGEYVRFTDTKDKAEDGI